MYSHPQDPSAGPSGAAEAPDQLEPGAPSAGDDAQHAHGTAAARDAGSRTSPRSWPRSPARCRPQPPRSASGSTPAWARKRRLQVEKVRARATAESAALRKGADDDVRQVESWCEEQIRQIHAEAERRVADRRVELERSVTQHGSLIETEVQSVHVAVQGYRGTLDEFFARMAGESDPSAIAGLAGTLPDAPDLDGVRADARSRAMKALEEQESAQATGDRRGFGAGRLATGEDRPRRSSPSRSDVEPVPVMDPEAAAASQDPAPGDEPGARHGSGGRRLAAGQRGLPGDPFPGEPDAAAPGPALTEARGTPHTHPAGLRAGCAARSSAT